MTIIEQQLFFCSRHEPPVLRRAAMPSDGGAHEFRANRIGDGLAQDPINLRRTSYRVVDRVGDRLDDALKFPKKNTAGSLTPIIRFQNAGYIMGDVAAKIESARYFAWRAADYLDKHSQHAELVGAMCKITVTEAMLDCVYKCMQVVGVNSLSTEYEFGKYLRETSILPIYDGGNMGMQRRVHGIIADENFNPRAVMDDDFVKFDRSMEAIGTVADPVSKSRGIMEAAE